MSQYEYDEEGCPCCGKELIENCCMECGEVYADIISGDADRDIKGLIWEPIIPLKNTVTGAAVKLKIWLNVRIKRFLFIKTYTYQPYTWPKLMQHLI